MPEPCLTFRSSIALLAWIVAFPQLALTAGVDSAARCEAAAAAAARETGVPLDILEAVALAESGRSDGEQLRPWPWAVSFAGQGRWYDDPASAELAVTERLALGATNIDIGCFQLNYHWHGDAFPSVGAMFDPERNAKYAAQFLSENYVETGDWVSAAAAYHSRTPEHADRYRRRVETLLAGTSTDVAAAQFDRVNHYPLLLGGKGGAIGSLVPALQGGASLFGETP